MKGDTVQIPDTRQSSMPELVAPRPRYADAEPLSQFTTATSATTQETGGQRTPGESRRLEKNNGAEAEMDSCLNILPRLGCQEDAAAAVEKLERIQRAREAKRRWKRGMGVDGLEKVARSKKDRHAKLDEKATANDSDSVASSLNLVGEVRLAITSMPGFNILASKARHVLDRADSPALEADGLEGTESLNKGSFGFRFGGRRRSSLIPASDTQAATSNSGVVQAQTEGVPGLPTADHDSLNAALPRPVAANPDLQPLQEERPIDSLKEIASENLSAEETAAGNHIVKPTPIRPRLTVRSPTQTDADSMPMAIFQSPEDYSAPSNALTDLLRMADSDRSVSELSASPGPSDGDALVAAEQCRKMLSKSPGLQGSPSVDDVASSSVRSPYSLSSESTSETDAGSSDDDDDDGFEEGVQSLRLQHSEQLTRKQQRRLARHIRRNKRRERRGLEQRPQGGGEVEEKLKTIRAKQHTRTGSLTNHISTGLHYATSQSRNRRAMEKFSPHPSRPNSTKPYQAAGAAGGMTSIGAVMGAQMNAQGSLSRSSTPANAVNSERSSFSNDESAREYATAVQAMQSDGTSRPTSPKVSGEQEQEEFENMLSRNPVRRWATGNTTSSVQKGGSLKNRLLSLRRNRVQPSDVPEEEADVAPGHEGQAEQELDNVLGRLLAAEAPDQLNERFEYDVLYENQRGMLFFGIPKFSAKTLFHWDPAPWTNAYNRNSAYNVVNAQLPNPSWEWVHPEWMIDMSGDVDEAGWQYSYNFGRFTFAFRRRAPEPIPRANTEGNTETNERFNKAMEEMEKHQGSREKQRADDGFEALKRTALTRDAKWSGIPTQNTYVRRRRWIRLRRRKPLQAATIAHTPKADTPKGVSKSGLEWDQTIKAKEHTNAGIQDEDINDQEEGSQSDNDYTSSDSELYGAEGRGESDFLPRRTTGDLKSGSDPMQVRDTREHRRRKRHAREFTGTVRELKSLLPTILIRKSGRSHRPGKTISERQKSLWLAEVDARNPFISWSFVKRRLADDDLAFPATTLRAYERRHAQRQHEKSERMRGEAEEKVEDVAAATDAEGSMIGSHAPWEQYELTKGALVEINLRRVLRVLKACKIDRHKLQLWRLWLGLDQLNVTTEPSRNEDLIELGLAASAATCDRDALATKAELARIAVARWRAAYVAADVADVWDVIERRLDRLLFTFEYQSSRAAFLRLLLTVHATSHPAHRFRPMTWRGLQDRTMPNEDNAAVSVPPVLSPLETISRANDDWQPTHVPRLEFYSDLIECARVVIGSPQGVRQTNKTPSPFQSPKVPSARQTTRSQLLDVNDNLTRTRSADTSPIMPSSHSPPMPSSTPGNGRQANEVQLLQALLTDQVDWDRVTARGNT